MTTILAGDSGSDEQLARAMMVQDTMGADINADVEAETFVENSFSMVVFPFACKCWMHQYHLIIQKSLQSTDLFCQEMQPFMLSPKKYVSTLAKVLHVWRDAAIKFSSSWRQLFASSDARQFAGKRPKLALSGRWGAVEDSEEFLLRPPIHQLQAVTDHVLPGGVGVATSTQKPAVKDAVGTEELSLEESKQYKEKMGRWRRDARDAIRDPVFIPTIVRIAHKVRKPLHRWYNWMKEDAEGNVVTIDGVERRHVSKFAEMLWYKAGLI